MKCPRCGVDYPSEAHFESEAQCVMCDLRDEEEAQTRVQVPELLEKPSFFSLSLPGFLKRLLDISWYGGIFLFALNAMARIYIGQIAIEGARLKVLPDMDAGSIFLGLTIIIIAKVFEHGLRLQQEHELTV